MFPPVILFEDDTLWLLHKPGGIHTVAHTAEDSAGSIGAHLLEVAPSLSAVSDRPGDAGLVNRLDFGTSGILIGAKTRSAWEVLRADIQGGRVSKRYLAVVEGVLSGIVERADFIGSPYRRAKKVRVYDSMPGDGRALSAHSIFTSRETNEPRNVSLVEILAPTARRHQIRAHASRLGHPLLGDALYGSTRSLAELFAPAVTPEFMLHAYMVELSHPVSGERVRVIDPPPSFLGEVFTQRSLQVE